MKAALLHQPATLLPYAPAGASPLRVLMVTARFFPHVGGTEVHTYEVAQRLAASGTDVTVLTTDTTGTLPTDEVLNGVRVLRVRAWPPERDYYFAPSIYTIITRGGWDLVHCQGYHTLVAPLAMVAARRAGIPYVVTFHSGGHSSQARTAMRGAQWALLRPLLARARRLIGVSAFEAGLFQQQLRLPDAQFVVIPNGVNFINQAEAPAQPDITLRERVAGEPADLPMPAQPEEPARPDAGTLILSVGRLEQYKGHHRVIAAMPALLRQYPDARLRIVGGGPYEPALRQLAAELGLHERVEIRGIPVEDRQGMRALLTQARLVTLLSDYESQGIAVMEALSLGRPVLVTDASALRELAERGLARAVSLDSTPEQIAAAMAEQLRNPLFPSTITLPTWDECAGQVAALYQSAVRQYHHA